MTRFLTSVRFCVRTEQGGMRQILEGRQMYKEFRIDRFNGRDRLEDFRVD